MPAEVTTVVVSAQVRNLANWYHLGGGGGKGMLRSLVTCMSLNLEKT